MPIPAHFRQIFGLPPKCSRILARPQKVHGWLKTRDWRIDRPDRSRIAIPARDEESKNKKKEKK